MLINFKCPDCRIELEVEARMGGTQSKCPHCGKEFVIPRFELGPGVTIGRFQIQKFLSRGGMGEVFLARQFSLGRDVALKILPAHLRDNPQRVRRFMKEVQTLARLDHPNIVMAHEAGEDEGILFLVMSYVAGDSLEQRLRAGGPLAEHDSLKLIEKIAGALDYAWREHHLLHRDIKPANILFTAGGEPKLTDFGLAKCLDDGADLTMSGDIIGSPNYMSPEQVNNSMDVDCRADMYSLGATLYHMLTGKLPFGGSSLMETLKKQISEALPDPRLEHPGISEACIILLEIMLAKDRKDRHQDYAALRADIARIIAGERPTKGELKPGESVMLRIIAGRVPQPAETLPGADKNVAWPHPEKKSDRNIKIAALIMFGLALVIFLAAVLARGAWRKAKRAQAAAAIPAAVASRAVPRAPAELGPPKADDINAGLRDGYLNVLKHAREHPGDFAGVLGMLEAMREKSKGTEWEGKIALEIEQTEKLRQRAGLHDMQALRGDVNALLAQNDFDGAIKRIETDAGVTTEATKLAREDLKREVKDRKQAAEDAKAREAVELERAKKAEAEAKAAALTRGLAEGLLSGNLAALKQTISEARADQSLGIVSNQVEKLAVLVLQVARWPEQVARSFEKSRDKPVTVELQDGQKKSFTVTGVSGDRIQGQQQLPGGYVGREIVVADLSTAEKLKGVGEVPPPAGKLMRGLILVRCEKNWEAAANEFAEGGLLGQAMLKFAPAMTRSVTLKPAGSREQAARQALQKVVQMTGLSGDLVSPQAVADMIRNKKYSTEAIAKIRTAMDDFIKNYGQTETAREYALVIGALENLESHVPSSQRPFRPRLRRSEQ